ncbi:hypothetical protein N9L68_06320 [bacterium]|nr:hypothetical protein [bacterium]
MLDTATFYTPRFKGQWIVASLPSWSANSKSRCLRSRCRRNLPQTCPPSTRRDWRVQRDAQRMEAAKSLVNRFCQPHVMEDSSALMQHVSNMKRRIKEATGIDILSS